MKQLQLTLEEIWNGLAPFFYPGIRPKEVFDMVRSCREYEMRRVVQHEEK